MADSFGEGDGVRVDSMAGARIADMVMLAVGGGDGKAIGPEGHLAVTVGACVEPGVAVAVAAGAVSRHGGASPVD